MSTTLRASGRRPVRPRSNLVGTGAVFGVVLAAAASLIALQGVRGACSEATPVKIVATPAIAGAIGEITQRDIDESCVAVRIVSQDAADTADELAAGVGETPALWIPDSTLWPKRARQLATSQGGAPARIEEHEPVVISPLVAVAAKADAALLGWPDNQPAWQQLIDGPVATTIGDPLSTTEGLATLLVVQRLLGNPDGSPRPELVAALMKVGRGAVTSVQTAYDQLGTGPGGAAGTAGPAFTASEQSVVAFNRAAGRTSVVAMYPRDGTLAMDYPVVRVRLPDEPSALADAADTVEAALRTPEALATFQAAGFRAPDGTLGTDPDPAAGIGKVRPDLLALPGIEQANEVLRTWSAVSLDVRMLVVIDVSGSMDADAGGGLTRIELARDAATTALQLYPDSTAVGLWAFSIQQRPPDDWIELVSIGPVGQDGRRAVLRDAFASLPARTDGATGLNDTVLAAFRQLRNTYDGSRLNTVVLLTDGRNDDSDGVSDEVLLRTLRAEADPARPVPVFPVGMGPEVDFDALQQIAAATGGKAYLARDPADIRSAFLDAVITRTCRPNC